jgi:hypothetical protein
MREFLNIKKRVPSHFFEFPLQMVGHSSHKWEQDRSVEKKKIDLKCREEQERLITGAPVGEISEINFFLLGKPTRQHLITLVV